MTTRFAVIWRVPSQIKDLERKTRVAVLSRFARLAAEKSAMKSSLTLKEFIKDNDGVPQPVNGVCWMVSHKPDIVAAIVSKERMGIDVEKIKAVEKKLFDRILSSSEQYILRNQSKELAFFRAFTAKEAVLKKTTHGIKGLTKVKIIQVMDDRNLILQYRNRKYRVENFYFERHLASVTKNQLNIQWVLE